MDWYIVPVKVNRAKSDDLLGPDPLPLSELQLSVEVYSINFLLFFVPLFESSQPFLLWENNRPTDVAALRMLILQLLHTY